MGVMERERERLGWQKGGTGLQGPNPNALELAQVTRRGAAQV